MIPDGFNRVHTVSGGSSFVYRPMLRYQMRAWKSLLPLDEVLFATALHAILDKQIVSASWEGGTAALNDNDLAEAFDVITTPPNHEANLYRVSCLAIRYPHLAATSCDSCKAWLWNPITGKLARRYGEPIPRDQKSVLLCQQPGGCPKGTPESPLEFTDANLQAYGHWTLAGTAGFPDDELVRRNWSIIGKAEAHARELSTRRSDDLRRNPPTHGNPARGGVVRPSV